MQYLNIVPKTIAEKYIESKKYTESKDGDLLDFKIHCFNGQPLYIQVNKMYETNIMKEVIYNTDWELQLYAYSHIKGTKAVDKPESLPL